MSINPSRNNVVAIIVTYFPNEGFPQRLDAVLDQVSMVVVVDNASTGRAKVMIENLCQSRSKVCLILNESNRGVAYALNQGCRWAIEQKYRWVLTFDQDTLPDKNLLISMSDVYSQINDKRVAVIGCNYSDPNLNIIVHQNSKGVIWEDRHDVITSGSLLSLSIYELIGGFNNDYFIDTVDEEFCLKCKIKNYRIIFIFKQLMVHSIGSARYHYLFGMKRLKFVLLHHSSQRAYFFIRNNMLVCCDFFRYYPLLMFKRFRRVVLIIILIIIFEENKEDKLRFSFLGFLDAIRRNMSRKVL